MAPDRWSNEKIIDLLNIYEKYECLWNVKNHNYRNRHARDAAYEIILKQLAVPGFTVYDLKNKIKGIRTTYAQEKNKVIKKKSAYNADFSYKPHLKWFQRADAFLRTVVVCRSTNLNMPDNGNGPRDNEDEPELSDFETELVENNKNAASPASCQNNSENISNTNSVPTRLQNNRNLRLKRKHVPNVQLLEKAIDKLTEISKPGHSLDEDEFEVFGKHVALQLKQLPLYRALYCQEKIQAIITQERLLETYEGQPARPPVCKPDNSPVASSCSYSSISTPLSEDPLLLDFKSDIVDEEIQI